MEKRHDESGAPKRWTLCGAAGGWVRPTSCNGSANASVVPDKRTNRPDKAMKPTNASAERLVKQWMNSASYVSYLTKQHPSS